MNFEGLSKKTVKELLAMAKELKISGRWEMTKAQLISAIEKASASTSEEVETVVDVTTKETAKENVGGIKRVKKEPANTELQEVNDVKKRYLDNIEIGSLVAFKIVEGKAKSAKVIKKNVSKQKLLVQTSYGVEYTIPFSKVIWVKTGKRWPKGVYQMLKGMAKNETE